MDSFGAEECHSSESGWTKYLGSHINDDDSGGGEDGNTYNSGYGSAPPSHPQNGDSDDDDSMASDASSGPSHRGKKKHDVDKKPNKTQENKLRTMEGKKKKKVEKKGVLIVDSKGKTPVQDGSKVRNFFCMGKKK